MKLLSITLISTICILAIFCPIRFMGNKKNDDGRRFSTYSTDGKIDTTKYTEEDIEMAFY